MSGFVPWVVSLTTLSGSVPRFSICGVVFVFVVWTVFSTTLSGVVPKFSVCGVVFCFLQNSHVFVWLFPPLLGLGLCFSALGN